MEERRGTSEMGQTEENCRANIFFRQIRQSFHAVCLTLLSHILPLSYLLLARVTSPHPFTLNSIILYFLVSFMSLSSLFSAITGYTLYRKLPNCIAWGFLCLFQACITFGIETMIREGFQPLENISRTANGTWLKRILLFIGIYDQMIVWKTMFVKPVVDDTIFDEERKERGIEIFVLGLSFSGLWQLLLQREVEPLVSALGREGLTKGIDWCDFILWLVTFATLLTGLVRAVKVTVWQLSILLQFIYCRVEQEAGRLTSEDNEV